MRILSSFFERSTLIFAVLLAGTFGAAEVQAANLRVTWDDTANNEDGFKIERLIAGVIDATIAVGPNANSYTDSGLKAGTVYCYRVLAFNGAGNSSASNQPCATASDSVVAPATVNLQSTATVNGSTLTFSWSGISAPTATDWAGIYSPGTADTSFLEWMYLSCSKTASTPQSSGACSYLLPQTLTAANYELRFFSNDGFARLGGPIAFNVAPMNVAAATLTVSPAKISAGGTVTVSWSGITLPSATDWIGLYTSGAADVNFLNWIYVSCSSTASSSQASGSCPYVLPKTLTASNYELRLFPNDSYIRIGSTTLAIIGTPPAPGNLIVQVQ